MESKWSSPLVLSSNTRYVPQYLLLWYCCCLMYPPLTHFSSHCWALSFSSVKASVCCCFNFKLIKKRDETEGEVLKGRISMWRQSSVKLLQMRAAEGTFVCALCQADSLFTCFPGALINPSLTSEPLVINAESDKPSSVPTCKCEVFTFATEVYFQKSHGGIKWFV